MVQDVLERTQAQEENLFEHRRHLQRAITAYAVNVCATVDEQVPATIERAHAALLPIVNFRQQSARGRSSGSAGSETVQESPDSGESD